MADMAHGSVTGVRRSGVHTDEVEYFVGRTEELAALEAAMRAVRAGQPRAVLVEGEAGVGKSSLVSHFAAEHPDACFLWVSGEESEMSLAWGVADQLLAAARSAAGESAPHAVTKDADPLAAGARLVAALGDLQAGDKVVVLVVDDLHWSDHPSARALLFALRRMQADRVLALVTVRPGELSRLGEGWSRFASGDHRAARLRLDGLDAGDLAAMARKLGAGQLTRRTVTLLRDHTGGNSLHCRALLEELGPGDLAKAGQDLPAPRALAAIVVSRLSALTEAAQRLVTAAAVLGRRCPLATAAALAGLADPLSALDEAAAAGLLVEDRAAPAADIAFAHSLVHAAVRDGISPSRARGLHRAAAMLVPGTAALAHRVAAAAGPDDSLADDLEAAAQAAVTAGRAAQAAAWLAQSAVLHDMGQLMGEQRPAPGAHRIVGAAAEEDMLARGERTRLEQAAELVGARVRVNPDPAEVRPERPFHRGAQGPGTGWPPALACRMAWRVPASSAPPAAPRARCGSGGGAAPPLP
jgi:AAA ATPase domain